MKRYDIAYGVTKRFKSDLLKMKDRPFFESLINHFIEDVSRYEAKVGLALSMIPFMDKFVVGRLMKALEIVLNRPATDCMMKHNINPLRVSMMLFRLVREI